MPKSDDVTTALADRLTDEQIGECAEMGDGSKRCSTHSIESVHYSVRPHSKRCVYWLDYAGGVEDSVRVLLEDETAKDILMEYWDV